MNVTNYPYPDHCAASGVSVQAGLTGTLDRTSSARVLPHIGTFNREYFVGGWSRARSNWSGWISQQRRRDGDCPTRRRCYGRYRAVKAAFPCRLHISCEEELVRPR